MFCITLLDMADCVKKELIHLFPGLCFNCLFPDTLDTLNTKFRLALRQVFQKSVTGVSSTQCQDEVATFRDIVRQFNYNEDDGDECGPQVLMHAPMHSNDGDEDDPQVLAHAPMHDAESVFWLIMLFFI